MKTLTITFLLLFITISISGQQVEKEESQSNQELNKPISPLAGVCATETLWDNHEEYARYHKQWKAKGQELKSRRAPTKINVVSHVFTKDDGSGSNLPTLQELTDDIYYTNIWYQMAGFNIELVLVSTGAINSTTLYDITDKTNLPYVTINNTYGVDNHINIYYGNTISHAPSGSSKNYIFHNMRDAGWGWTVAHELGHWFGLDHTFKGSGSENVTRNSSSQYYNCLIRGDYLCDTPADYGTDWCNSDDDECDCGGDYDDPECTSPELSVYTTKTDAEGLAYMPDLLNLMAYGCRPCAHLLTQGQVDIMWTTLGERLTNGVIQHDNCNPNAFLEGNLLVGERTEATNNIDSKQNIITQQYIFLDGANQFLVIPGISKANGGE